MECGNATSYFKCLEDNEQHTMKPVLTTALPSTLYINHVNVHLPLTSVIFISTERIFTALLTWCQVAWYAVQGIQIVLISQTMLDSWGQACFPGSDVYNGCIECYGVD